MSDKKMPTKDDSKKYTALIIGAGRIAASFDGPDDTEILTHAHAYVTHPAVTLSGFFDRDTAVAQAAASRWGCSHFASLEAALREEQPDILSVCTPDGTHASILEELIPYKPKIVICEKPLATDIVVTERIVRAYEKAGIPLLTNYSRRFDSTVRTIQSEVLAGRYGKVISAYGIYSKGLLHTGSHVLDLARYFFGEAIQVIPLTSRVDYLPEDPTVGGFVTFERCPEFHLMAADERRYGVFEFGVLTEQGRITFLNYGFEMSMQTIQEDARYRGFFSLGKPIVQSSYLPQACAAMVQNAIDYIEKKSPLWSTGEEALATEQLCKRLRT